MSTDSARIAELERRVAELSEQYSSAQRELEAFQYAISHDLRAPLRSLSGFSQALSESLESSGDTKTRHYLDRIQQANRRMSDLIDALLSLSRVSRAELHPRDVDFTQLCTDVGALVKTANSSRAIEVKVTPGLRAYGDPRQLKTLVELLMDNAVKFSGKRSRTVIEIGTKNGAFYLSDNGAGFDMAYAEKLFKPFQRLHADSDFPGIGIGLATVQRIVSRHNGRCWLTGTSDGATAFFTLTAAPGKT